MNLYHYSDVPLAKIEQYYSSGYKKPPDYFKPHGFWVSVGADWASYCRREQFRLETLQYKHKVTLKKNANILYITTASEMDVFTREYEFWPFAHEDLLILKNIDWARVEKEYQGIIIAPYLYERRQSLHTFWYYSWDCASGCIWDTAAIKSARLIYTASPVLKPGSAG